MLTPDALRNALLADDVAAVTGWLADGGDPDAVLDRRGARPLFFACTAAMARTLLAAGGDPRRTLSDGTSSLDAAAIEGQTELVRVLLAAAPDLATEERALLAADHPDTETLIRTVARGDRPDPPATTASRLALRQVPFCADPRAPAIKGSQRYYGPRDDGLPTHRGELDPEEVPGWARPHLVGDAVAFTGPAGSVLVLRDRDTPLVITPDSVVDLDVPPVRFPYEHAFDAAGTHHFFGYGQHRVVGIEVATGTRVVDLDLPGAPWGRALVGLDGEDLRGHTYPARLAVAGSWLVAVSLERIHLVPFGEAADQPPQWYTCQLGTCVAVLRAGRLALVGARSGGVVFGLHEGRAVRLTDLPAPADNAPSALHGHLRMALRVSDRGLDDIRTLKVRRWGESTEVVAYGTGGLDERSVRIPGLVVRPGDVEATWPTAPEIVDAFELDGTAHVRVSPIGRTEVRSYVVEGLDELWDATFAPAPRPRRATRSRPEITRAPLPRPYDPPHRDIGTLSYSETGPTGYGFGFRVSGRPGFWNSYVVDSQGVHPLSPHWYSGVTLQAWHESQPLLLGATGHEVIEVDLATRAWRRRDFGAPVRGVSYFDPGIAVLLADELVLLPDLEGEITLRARTTTRASAQMGSFHGHRVLWVPTGADGNVLLARRDGGLVVAGVFRADTTGSHQSPDGEFFALKEGTLTVPEWPAVLAAVRPWTGTPLDRCRSPRITVRL